MINLRVCVICGEPYVIGRQYTCSEKCHRKFVRALIKKSGKYKKVIDARTGVAHRVPTKDIIEKGLQYKDLPNYPLWESDRRHG